MDETEFKNNLHELQELNEKLKNYNSGMSKLKEKAKALKDNTIQYMADQVKNLSQ